MPAKPLRVVRAPRLDPEFEKLIAPLSREEHTQLEANLVAEGCRDALVAWKGILLDGHQRLEICTRLSIKYRTTDIELPSREAAKLWIEENQIGRRNLTPDQRAALAYRIMLRRVEVSKVERARKGGLTAGNGRAKLSLVVNAPPSNSQQRQPRQAELTAAQVGVATRKLRLVGELAKHDPAIVERIATGNVTLSNANIEIKEGIRIKQRKAALKTHSDGGQIHTDDYGKLWDLVKDNSVDLFLSDPVYNDIEQYRGLAKLAKAKLKPGGSCVVCLGAYHLPEVLSAMTPHLEYVWMIAMQHGYPLGRVWSKKVWQRWQPVLIFRKPSTQKKLSHEWFFDLLETADLDKITHKWGKSGSNFCYFVERFSTFDGLVVDPFVGGGTTPVACKLTGRRFIGTEIDAGVAAAARERVASTAK